MGGGGGDNVGGYGAWNRCGDVQLLSTPYLRNF
jgi:hypothetical protein